MRKLNPNTITQAMIERFSKTHGPRLKEIMTSLVRACVNGGRKKAGFPPVAEPVPGIHP